MAEPGYLLNNLHVRAHDLNTVHNEQLSQEQMQHNLLRKYCKFTLEGDVNTKPIVLMKDLSGEQVIFMALRMLKIAMHYDHSILHEIIDIDDIFEKMTHGRNLP